MRKKSNLIKGIIVLVAVVTVFLLLPAAASATIYPFCRFWGPVTLNGNNIPAGSTVTVNAWIDGVTTGSIPTSISYKGGVWNYILDFPASSNGAAKDGGVDGSIVRFSATIDGVVYYDAKTSQFETAANVNHNLFVGGATVPVITTTALPQGHEGVAYSFSMAAGGGIGAYTWSASGLPANLTINSVTGLISGIPGIGGTYPVIITVTDSASPANQDTKNYNLVITDNGGALQILTTELTRNGLEVYPATPPAGWLPLPPPGWVIGQAYTTTLTAIGGTGDLVWSASNLPAGLNISTDGVVTGTPTTDGLYNIKFDVHDSAAIPLTDSVTLTLMVYLAGDGNGSGKVSIADVTYVERVILGLAAPTAGCDANISQTISIADVTKIERIILGLP